MPPGTPHTCPYFPYYRLLLSQGSPHLLHGGANMRGEGGGGANIGRCWISKYRARERTPSFESWLVSLWPPAAAASEPVLVLAAPLPPGGPGRLGGGAS